MKLNNIQQPFIKIFSGDFSKNPAQRITPKVLFSIIDPIGFPDAEIILFNEKLSEEIGLGKMNPDSEIDRNFLTGTEIPSDLQTYATAYAGHQFGNWAGQLGDGRAIFAGEIQNNSGEKTEIQWKGAGATPYSRNADGRAVLRSSVREYLMSESIHFLKIPTTRALSLATTGEKIVRDIMYNGNPEEETGAVIVRTAESFLRFGHFELLSAQKEFDSLKKLTDFCIENYYPEIQSIGNQKYKAFFEEVCKRTARLMVEWFRVGFVHGVMNTDNMSILGLTIDFGPFSMLDQYDLNFTPNTTDLPGRRYAFGKQGQISQWNLWQLANALFPLIEDEKFLEKVLDDYSTYFWENHDEMLSRKFGFEKRFSDDEAFFIEWQQLMQDLQLDYTLFFNEIEKEISTINSTEFLHNVSYSTTNFENEKRLNDFLEKYQTRLQQNQISDEERRKLMAENNPKFVLRNYLLYQCIEELEAGKKELLEKLITALQNPYQEIFPEFSQKRPSGFDGTIGCSMLSCSS